MRPNIRIVRHPYEEPYHLNLEFQVCNGRSLAHMECYLHTQSLFEWADALEVFPRHPSDVFLVELGSERPEDRWAYYFRFRAFVTDGVGHCALHIRFNNNEELPDREIAEFCIKAEASQVNHLGRLLREFGKLQSTVLDWWVTDGTLYESTADAQQHVPGDAAR